MVDKKQQNEEEKKKRKKLILIILIIICVLAILALGVIWYMEFGAGKPSEPIVSGDVLPERGENVEEGTLETMTEDEIREQMQRVADASYLSFKVNARPVFNADTLEGDVSIENPNYNVFPFVVEYYLNANNELIYSSGSLMPNEHIDRDKLGVELKAGQYEATAHIVAYDPDTHKRLGHQQVGLIITIEQK